MSLIAQDIQETQLQEFAIHEATQTIIIKNKNFELFLSGIVEDAVQAGKQGMLSEALLRCYECMINDQKECFIKDLQEAMPELLMIAEAYCHDKAPRPGVFPPGHEIVGPGSCDFGAVIGFLQQVFMALNKCCAILQQDFRETLTILAKITNEIQGTFTVLADLKATISSDFNQTWTILADIKSTITECCANITREFQETWTIIDAASFTMIDISATVSSGFNQTWTILADIKSTVTECCANITREFQETWTILEAGFNNTFSLLIDTNATVSSDFNQTWTILADIKSTSTECCANITREFQETWTILDAGFNNTFTVLIDINATVSSDFNQTWTILADIKSTITECCENITREFQETWDYP